jgi:uncharacterized protein (TIGR00251 family)
MNIPATRNADGILLHVRLTPKSGSSRVCGRTMHGEKSVVKMQVTAPPEDGKANAAVAELVADWIGISKSRVAVVSGQKSRLKSLFLKGNADELFEKLAILLQGISGVGAQRKTQP